MSTPRRSVRIAGCAGGNTDRWDAISSFAKDPEIDAIIGDWLSESNMASSAAAKIKTTNQGGSVKLKDVAYASEFLQCFEPAIADLKKNSIKLIVNAGAADTELLAHKCKELLMEHEVPMKVAWIKGDDVTQMLKDQLHERSKGPIEHVNDDIDIRNVFAQCYLGGWAITEALKAGADLVICGRVSDASPVVGMAAYWHAWKEVDFDCLAGALMAGHLIECSGYATGGNFTGFKNLLSEKKHLGLGFPIAEVESDGTFTIAKEKHTGGCVTVASLTSQLVYEIQGPWYFNSDVTAILSDTSMEQVGEDRVRVTGIKGMPPPPTTKVGITQPGGYQAEFHAFITGLDIEEKCQWFEEQIRYAIGKEISRFDLLKIHRVGSPSSESVLQDHATVMLRVFAQAQDVDLFRTDVPNCLFRWCMSTFLMGCPGLTPSNDTRLVAPKAFNNYFTAFMPQDLLHQQVECLFGNHSVIHVRGPSITRLYDTQPSYETASPVDLATFGDTVEAPLGSVVHGRAGDKGANCNIGFYVQGDEEWAWLRTFLTVERIKALLGPVEYSGNPIERFEIPGLHVVHFLLKSHLDRGYNASSSVDVLGKNTCEFLRAKKIYLPAKFLKNQI